MALAMEARCYHGGDGRTKLYPLKYRAADIVAYLFLLAYLGGIIAIGIIYGLKSGNMPFLANIIGRM